MEIIQKLRQQERKEHKYEKQQAFISRLKPFERTVGKTREWHLYTKNSQTEAKLLDLANWMGTLQVVFVALSCMNGTGHNTVPELPQSS